MEIKKSKYRPQHIQREITRHGREVYYFRKTGSIRVRLDGEYGSPEFWKNYALAASGAIPDGNRPRGGLKQRDKRREMSLSIRQALPAAKHRAAKRGLPFDLTEDWALEQIKRQNFKCALTGIPFLDDDDKRRVRAYAPSFDRIDNSKGYTIDNVRIVVFAINAMLLDWGEEVFYRVSNGYRHVRNAGS
jgi:hypothetical protein